MTVSVLIPTYRRPRDLECCLRAVEQQTRKPDEVVVVVRDDDLQTAELLAQATFHVPLHVVAVTAAGQVAALNRGLDEVRGEVVAMTDDDARPRRDWLERIARHFEADDTLGGVGGRDFVHDGRVYGDARVVGKVQWFGRYIGNHHRGIGPPRDVDLLKGVNMSYRRRAIAGLRFDTRLLGRGAQRHNDMCFSLSLRKRGWRLLYDAAIAVDHFSGVRFDDDRRLIRSSEAVSNDAHNETVALLQYLPPVLGSIFLAWSVIVGHRSLPGIVQCLRFMLAGRPVWQLFPPVLRGRIRGWRTAAAR